MSETARTQTNAGEASGSAPPRHGVTRVRRETRRRRLSVVTTARLTPNMQRIVLRSDDLHDFESLGADDHVKLFLPAADGQLHMRDYTPRAWNAAEGLITLDFALHEAGPATAWALQAKVGDPLQMGGPRGSSVLTDDFDWYLLVGDETALPAIGRRLEELRAGVEVTSFVVVEGLEDRQAVSTRTSWTPHWIARDKAFASDAERLQTALDGWTAPPGEGYVWIAAEAKVARKLRRYMVETRGHPIAWLKAAGYWLRGEAAVHQVIDD